MTNYQPASPLNRTDTDVLGVHCGDHRFQAAFHEFLTRASPGGNYDLLVIPGGPQSLTLVEYLPKFSWSSWRWLGFFVESHDLKRLILIQHQDCAWYKSLPLHLHDFPEPRARQEQDLRRVKSALAREFPQLAVELYFASWDAGDRISIEAIHT